MDAHTLLNQIGIGNLMAVGARQLVKDEQNRCIMLRVGKNTRTKLAKLIITLDPDDTYSVCYREVDRITGETLVEEVTDGVYCDSIGAVVRRMGDRA